MMSSVLNVFLLLGLALCCHGFMTDSGGGNPDLEKEERDWHKTNTFGTLLLDAVMWDKVVPNQQSNILFMVSNKAFIGKPETDRIRDDFLQFARKSHKQNELLFSQIIVNGAENARLAQEKFGLTDTYKMKHPHFFLLRIGEGVGTPLQTPETVADLKMSDIAYYCKKQLGVSFFLEGTHAHMDSLAEKFMSEMANAEDRGVIIDEARQMIGDHKEKLEALIAEIESGDDSNGDKSQEASIQQNNKKVEKWNAERTVKNMENYVKVMEKVLERGDDYTQQETDRLLAIIDSDKVSESRKEEFRLRINSLASFSLPETIAVPRAIHVGSDGALLE